MIVTDASVLTYLVVQNEQSELAAALYDRDPVWVAPLLWRSEFANALGKYVLHAGMHPETALLAARSAEDVIAGREYRVSLEQVLDLAARSRCPAYDCEYVALAIDLGVPLVTTDKKILRAFPKTARSLEKFVRKR